jgi:hypothetical protein
MQLGSRPKAPVRPSRGLSFYRRYLSFQRRRPARKSFPDHLGAESNAEVTRMAAEKVKALAEAQTAGAVALAQ